jgi:hypothetical protein
MATGIWPTEVSSNRPKVPKSVASGLMVALRSEPEGALGTKAFDMNFPCVVMGALARSSLSPRQREDQETVTSADNDAMVKER